MSSFDPLVLIWRKGPGDQGRDIQARFRRNGAVGELIEEEYFIEAKHYQTGVPPTALSSALAWSQAEQPSVLLIVVSSHITTPCRENLDAWAKNNPRTRISLWERKEVENEVLKNLKAREMAISFGLLPPSIEAFLPPNPAKLCIRQDPTGFPMAYRYWLTEEEIEKLGYVVQLLEDLSKVLIVETGPYKYFEDICLAIPNWSTFLRLLQVQLRLQIAIRDYLLALHSNVTMTEIYSLADMVKQCVKEVQEIGDSSYHVLTSASL